MSRSRSAHGCFFPVAGPRDWEGTHPEDRRPHSLLSPVDRRGEADAQKKKKKPPDSDQTGARDTFCPTSALVHGGSMPGRSAGPDWLHRCLSPDALVYFGRATIPSRSGLAPFLWHHPRPTRCFLRHLTPEPFFYIVPSCCCSDPFPLALSLSFPAIPPKMNRASPFDQASRSLIDRRGNNPVSAGGELRSEPPRELHSRHPCSVHPRGVVVQNGSAGAPMDADGAA